MKILCIHGFRHNSEIMKKSMQSIIKKYGKHNIEFEFYDSPIKYVQSEEDQEQQIDYRQWWNATRHDVLTIKDYDTCEESLNNLKTKWLSDKYDGLLGFSQGSILAQIFAYQIQKKIIQIIPGNEPKFIILCSTFPISDTHYKTYYDVNDPLIIPTVLMIGSRDTLCSLEEINNMRKFFSNETMLIHSGGHYVGTSSETTYNLLTYLKKFIN